MDAQKHTEPSWQDIAVEEIIESLKPLDNNWVEGYVEDYKFQAKVFLQGSKYGIDGGRISKLWIVKIDPLDGSYRETVVNYDRGWDQRPKAGKDTEIYNLILGCLEDMPEDMC